MSSTPAPTTRPAASAAPDVQSAAIPLQRALVGEDLGSEGLVHFDVVHVAQRQAGTLQGQRNRRRRSVAHDSRLDRGLAERDDRKQRLESVGTGTLSCRQQDRKKHLIITAGGKNLSPGNIEAALKSADPLISHVIAHGDRRQFVSALLAPSPLETLDWGLARGLVSADEVAARQRELFENPTARSEALARAMEPIVRSREFESRMQAAVRQGNHHLAHVEKVRRFLVLPRDLCQEQGELTPTMKVRRREVEQKYLPELDRLYQDEHFGLSV